MDLRKTLLVGLTAVSGLDCGERAEQVERPTRDECAEICKTVKHECCNSLIRIRTQDRYSDGLICEI